MREKRRAEQRPKVKSERPIPTRRSLMITLWTTVGTWHLVPHLFLCPMTARMTRRGWLKIAPENGLTDFPQQGESDVFLRFSRLHHLIVQQAT